VKKILLLLICFGSQAFLMSCHSSKVRIPSDIIPEKKMQLVLLDVITAEAEASQHPLPADTNKSITNRLYNEIFLKYNISKVEYTKSYDFYSHHPALFEKNLLPILDSLNAMDARTPAGNTIVPGVSPSSPNNAIIRNMPRPILRGK
jgi:hypothetical protein